MLMWPIFVSMLLAGVFSTTEMAAFDVHQLITSRTANVQSNSVLTSQPPQDALFAIPDSIYELI